MLGCKPIEKQRVDFYHDELVTINSSDQETDKDGYYRAIITAGDDEGLSTITAKATVSYYGIEIVSNGQEFNGPKITKELQNQIEIFIYDNVAVYRVDLNISAQKAQSYVVCAPLLPASCDELYRTTLNYTANCSFEVTLPIDDINKMDISGIQGSGIQSLEILSVKPTSYTDTACINIEEGTLCVYTNCIEANASNIQSSKAFDFMTVIASADNKTKKGEFCLISPKTKPAFDILYPNINSYHNNPFENMTIIDFSSIVKKIEKLDVKDISFSSWNIHWISNITSNSRFIKPTTIENNTDCLINGFSNLDQPKLSAMFEPPVQFQLNFEDGYTDNGYCYIGMFSPATYQLRVTKLR